MSLLSTLHISHVILESPLLTLSRNMFSRNLCYEFLSTLEQNDAIAPPSLFLILNTFSNLVLVLQLLILSMYIIAWFDNSFSSRFLIKMNSSFIVYLLLERISLKWNAHPWLPHQNKIYLLQNLLQTVR